MQDRYFSDEELVAFLDGEDDFAPTQEIINALEKDPALAMRLEALEVDTNAIAISLAMLEGTNRTRPILPAQTVAPSLWPVAMASTIALAIGIGFGAFAFDTNQSNWKTYVAAYQALYTNSTLAHVNNDAATQQAELQRVSASIGKVIDLGKLQSSPELSYKRAQILGYKGKALIQLTFLSSMGEPIALCIIRANDETQADIAMKEMEGMSAAAWSSKGYEFFLIGGTDQPFIERLARNYAALDL